MRRLLSFGLVLGFLPLLAQRGDRPGEVMQPPPATWKIPPAPALAPEDALKTLKLAPGFRAELVAAEPLVHEPVTIAFGPDGRLWVAEMRGYMPNVDGQGEDAPVGSIAVLEDTDGDGRMDKRTVFLDRLVLPRAIALVDGGVLVGEPPNLWFCRDTDGDGVCDEKTRVADNYGPTNNPELAANGLLWALDNWIYNANHGLRLRYEGGGKFRSESGPQRGQWGIAQDDVGRLYYNHNTSPLHGDLVPAEYLARNRNLTAAGANVILATTNLRLWPSRVTPGVNRGYRILRADGTLPAVTAACGPVIYRGARFPAEFSGNAFFCEPAANLVKRVILDERDGDVKARNAYENAEFLASTDERFRPVNLANGPDGALYVVDLYRGLIQHRIYVTSYLRQQVEARALDQPTGLGRIYRIVPAGGAAANVNAKPNLARATVAELVRTLSHANGWWRDTAQRLLVERRAQDAAAALRTLALDAKAAPLGRLHALWTLEGRAELDRSTVLSALDDADPRVQAAAIRLAEPFLGKETNDAIAQRLLALARTGTTAPVRLQLALSLGAMRSPAGDNALQQLARTAGAQAYLADAAVSGLADREVEFIDALAKSPGDGSKVIALATSAVLKSGQSSRIDRVLHLLNEESAAADARRAVLAGVDAFIPRTPEGAMRTGTLPAEPKALTTLAKRDDSLGRETAELMKGLSWPGKPGTRAATPAAALTAEETARFEAGRTQFASLCAACHQPTGLGTPGVAPALVGSRWVLGDDRVLARIVLNGKSEGPLIMPPLHAALNDEAIAAVLTFVRGSWGNRDRPVTPATVAEARRGSATRAEPWTSAELENLLQELPARRRSF
ncbi:MAG TPA: c-type cytochrome [Opitutaceae bacterium]|nr:c-type cytochrome [Opitutaceae bacterium]